MIRYFGSSGLPAGYVKLYSSSLMSDSGAFDPAQSGNTIPASWINDPALYSDLNSPVKTAGISYYPIVDPAAVDTNRTEGAVSANAVDQFQIDKADPAVIASSKNTVPMPVQWLYVLQDGTTISPTGGGNAATVAGATATNPIVSRIAFWTDDEASKVNVNTASEGTYFDIPHADTIAERQFAKAQPLIGEYQRYPGHPAITSLSAILESTLPSPGVVNSSNYSSLQKYYELTPRVREGGTKGGTVETQQGGTVLAPKLERLYTSLDELFYKPDRSVNNVGLTPTALQRLRFFLTSNSRAPEMNLFGRPRVTIWPIYADPAKTAALNAPYRTQQDRLIAFCSEIKNKPYYFQRYDPKSGVNDYDRIPRNKEIYAYLQKATENNIPGFGGNFQSKYTAPERDQILTEMFDYIRSSNLNDPKLPPDKTYTWFYNSDPSIPYDDPHGQYANYYSSLFNPSSKAPKESPGQVLPIRITAPGSGTLTKGAGRFPVIDQAALIFYLTQEPKTNNAPTPVFETKIRCVLVLSLFHPMQGFMCALDRFKVLGTSLSDFKFTPDNTMGGGGSLGFFQTTPGTPGPGAATLWANSNAKYGTYEGRNWGANHSIGPFVLQKSLDPGEYRSPTEEVYYSFASNVITLTGSPTDATRCNFEGGDFDVRVQSANGEEIQKYTFHFPNVSNVVLPKESLFPSLSATAKWYLDLIPVPRPDTPSVKAQRFQGSISNATGSYNGDAKILSGDVARSIQLDSSNGSRGDQRLLAYTRDIPESWFSPHKKYSDGETRFAHNLRQGNGNEINGAFSGGGSGNLVNGLSFTDQVKRPWIRSEADGVTTTAGSPGDWDTGFGAELDGAYISKADEGASSHEAEVPYFFAGDTRYGSAANLTAPNRQMPSAAIFGSLPTGVKRLQPWQTLLYRPDPAGTHPGSSSPKDHLWLDLFQMPIVEPYAISEPFSTGGKININYQIIPFTYIKRDAGVRAVLKNERLIAIPDTDLNKYKNSNQTGGNIRLALNLDETLKSFENRFASGDIFRSASEICDIPLVPVGKTLADMSTFWSSYRLTRDNLKERPYATIYPRITTKSNVFTVHYRVQLLKKSTSRIAGDPTSFDTSRGDAVSGEYRGQTVIERYLDPHDVRLPDFTTDFTASAESYYRFRELDSRQFNP